MQETSPLGLDGAQFTGIAREIPQSECKGIHQDYYRLNFPDVLERTRWQLPLHEFYGDGLRRFYELLIKEWWLLDIDAWLQTKEDKRVTVPLNQLVVPKQEICGNIDFIVTLLCADKRWLRCYQPIAPI
ncbi:TPA: hypothetical protein ACGBIE_000247 [Yersinia enterocolitica]